MPKPAIKEPVLDTADPLMAVNEIAEFLGWDRATVYRYMRNGMLPYVMLGERRRVYQSDVRKLIEAGT